GLRFVLVARERASVIGVAGLLAQAVFLALCVVGVRGPENVLRVPLFWIAAVCIRSGVQLSAVLREPGAPRFALSRRALARWQRAAIAVGAGSIARGLMTVADVVVLGVLVVPERVAPYGIANKLPLFLASLAGLVHVALFPTLARTI